MVHHLPPSAGREKSVRTGAFRVVDDIAARTNRARPIFDRGRQAMPGRAALPKARVTTAGRTTRKEMTEIVLTTGDHHRHSGDLRINNRTHTVAQTAAGMQINESGFTGCLRVPVSMETAVASCNHQTYMRRSMATR
jgi:hypothetical protein